MLAAASVRLLPAQPQAADVASKLQRGVHSQELDRAPWAPRPFLMHLCSLGLFGLQLRRFLRASAKEPRTGIRVNRLKAGQRTISRFRQAGWSVTPSPWCRDGFLLDVESADFEKGLCLEHLAGEIYFQELTSMLPVEALLQALSKHGFDKSSWRPQDLVLDLCAAPGSKTTQIGSWLASNGICSTLIANEPLPDRAQILRTNLLRAGLSDWMLLRGDGREVGRCAKEAFRAVLVDAPCSAEGTVRNYPEVLRQWADDEHMTRTACRQELQRELLESGWQALAPGGCLVYSTCTLNSAENEEQCEWLLQQHPDAEAVDLPSLLGLQAAAACKGSTYLRLWPHVFNAEGFFVSCFRKTGTNSSATGAAAVPSALSSTVPESWQVLPEEQAAQVEALSMAELNFWPFSKRVKLFEDAVENVWLLPDAAVPSGLLSLEQLTGIRVATRAQTSVPTASSDQMQLAEELYLLAGRRAAGARGLGHEGWAKILAEVEGSPAAITQLMEIHASKGDVSTVRALLTGMLSKQVKPGIRSFNTLLKAHVKVNDLGGAEQVMRELRSTGLQPDIVSFTLLLGARAARPGRKEQASKAAAAVDDLLNSLAAERLQPDIVCFGAAAEVHAAAGDAARVEELLEEMQSLKVKPNMLLFTSLIKAYAATGNAASAKAALQTAKAQGLEPDVLAYNSLLQACACQGDAPSAVQTLNSMCEQALSPTASSHNTVIKAYLQADDAHGAECALQAMQISRLQPDVISYTTVLRAYTKSSEPRALSKAQAVLEDMCSKRIRPNLITFNTLMQGCASRGDADAARQTILNLMAEGLVPDQAIVRSLSRAHARAGNSAGLRGMLLELRERRVQPAQLQL